MIHTFANVAHVHYMHMQLYCIAGKFHGRLFRDFVLIQTFCGIKFAICMLIVRVCALILTILQINFCELDQIVKNAKF